ncbi:eukaryotic translation initiation factor 3 subunit F-like [Physella acuta]|uniref:eukaryotic translation initiation factor 3 subunit F-like n=1 Tax=Physella acuta TaxID=109671 RepID=UPI0027DBB8A1|nr:eukaryotic translation initiation factor 3 subunit F-like [Physella acuta]
MASSLVCKVHTVVLFSVIDAYERRNEDAKRVIGTLLGVCEKGVVEVTNCFAVPHNESDDEVAVDIEYARNMFELHKRVNNNETIVGWFSTGSEVSVHSVLIHDYYSREAKNPIHLTVDTFVRGGKMGIKAYHSTSIGVPGKTTGTMFTPVPVEIVNYEPEQVGVEVLQKGKYNSKRLVKLNSDLRQVENLSVWLKDSLVHVIQYVDDVLSGKLPSDNVTGRFLLDLVTGVPHIEADKFEEMLNANMKDLLMVVYLANLTKTQLALNEKLSTL